MEKNISIITGHIPSLKFKSTIKNHSFCLIEGKILLLPNSAIKIISIVYKFLESSDNIELETYFVLEISTIGPIGPSNYLAIINGIEFLLKFKKDWPEASRDGRSGIWKNIFKEYAISNRKLEFKFSEEFLLKIKDNINAGIPLIKSDGKNRGSSSQFPLELNI